MFMTSKQFQHFPNVPFQMYLIKMFFVLENAKAPGPADKTCLNLQIAGTDGNILNDFVNKS